MNITFHAFTQIYLQIHTIGKQLVQLFYLLKHVTVLNSQ